MTVRLEMVREALRRLCEEAGDIGPYPTADTRLLRLEEGDVKEALQAWTAYKNGTLETLQNRPLAQILENMGQIAGERFGLDGPCAMRFGQWLAQAVTGWHSGPSDDEEIDALSALAARAMHGRDSALGFAWTYADWWMRYQRAIPPMMAKLQEDSA